MIPDRRPAPSSRATIRRRAGQRLLRLLRPEDPERPLLFSRLPRMLRGDGTTPRSLQRAFRYLDPRRPDRPPVTVSSERWNRALATSRRLAARRAVRGRDP